VAPAVCALHMRNGWISHSFGELRKNGHLLALISFQTYVALSVKYILKVMLFWDPTDFHCVDNLLFVFKAEIRYV